MNVLAFPLATTAKRAAASKWLVATIGVSLFAVLWLVGQPYVPSPWFDEGLNVSTAAMLARTGLYALPDSGGPRVFDPAIQTGPTVLIPVALAFRALGVGIFQARLPMFLFAILTLIAYALTARRLIGSAAGLAVVLLVIGNLVPDASFTYMSRQVLGEVPALGLCLLGLLCWWHALEQHDRAWPGLVGAGLAWGLAMVTKAELMLLLPVSLGLLALVDQVYYRRAGWRAFLLPGALAAACLATWYVAQIAILGWEQFWSNAAVLREGSAIHLLGFDPVHWRHALGVFWRSGWWAWGLPGIVWGVWQARQRSAYGFRHAAALALPLVGLCWFTVFTIGWARYTFYSFILSSLWTAGLFVDLWRGRPRLLTNAVWRAWLVGGLLALYCGINGWPLLAKLVSPEDTGYFAMRDYLATRLPANATLETWEWEFSLDARQPIHHPATSITNLYSAYIWDDRHIPSELYDARQAQPEYILVGPFGAWTSIYCGVISNNADCIGRSRNVESVASFGNYALYALRP